MKQDGRKMEGRWKYLRLVCLRVGLDEDLADEHVLHDFTQGDFHALASSHNRDSTNLWFPSSSSSLSPPTSWESVVFKSKEEATVNNDKNEEREEEGQ